MGLFGKTLEETIEELHKKGIEDTLAFSLAYNMMKLEFPNKFPKGKETKFTGTTHHGIIEIVANLKIKKDEIYERDIEINGEAKKYRIILKKDTIKEWEDKQKQKEAEKEEEQALKEKEDNEGFIKMLKWVGIIAGIIILFLIIRAILF